LRARGVAPAGILLGGNAEQQDASESQSGDLADFVDQDIGRHLEMSGHGGDFLPDAASRPDEEGKTRFAGESVVSRVSLRTAGW